MEYNEDWVFIGYAENKNCDTLKTEDYGID